MSQQFPNDVAETRTKILPGPIKGTCPPFKEIMVIDARKVFDFCFQEDILDRCFFVPEVGTGAEILDCEIVDVTCVEIMEREPIPETGGLALVSLQVTLTLRITLIPTTGATPIVINRPIAFPKRVVVCAPDGTDVNCDVRGTCICTLQPPVNQVTTTEPNVCCTIQLSVVDFLDDTSIPKNDSPYIAEGIRKTAVGLMAPKGSWTEIHRASSWTWRD